MVHGGYNSTTTVCFVFFIQLCPSVLILVDAKDSDSVQLRELWDQDAEQRRSIYHKVRSVVLGIKTCQKVAVKKQKKGNIKKKQQQHFTEAIQIQRCNDVLWIKIDTNAGQFSTVEIKIWIAYQSVRLRYLTGHTITLQYTRWQYAPRKVGYLRECFQLMRFTDHFCRWWDFTEFLRIKDRWIWSQFVCIMTYNHRIMSSVNRYILTTVCLCV